METEWTFKKLFLDGTGNIVGADWQATFTDPEKPGVNSTAVGVSFLPPLGGNPTKEAVAAAVITSLGPRWTGVQEAASAQLGYEYALAQLTPTETEIVTEEFPKLTPRQIRFGLLSIGITSQMVEAALADNEEGKIEWNHATYFRRDHPLVGALAAGFALPSNQVDTLWKWAATL